MKEICLWDAPRTHCWEEIVTILIIAYNLELKDEQNYSSSRLIHTKHFIHRKTLK